MDKIYKVVVGVVMGVIAVVGFSITIYQTFHVPLANAIQDEKVCRMKCDEEMRIEMRQIVGEFKLENQQAHGSIEKKLERVLAKLERK